MPRSQLEPAEQSWDLGYGRSMFDAEPESVYDVASGWGHRLMLADTVTHTVLELYPSAGMVRLTSQSAQIELHRQKPPVQRGEFLIFTNESDSERLQLTVSTYGNILLTVVPAAPEDAPESPTEDVSDARGAGIPEEQGTPENGPSRGADDDTPVPSTGSVEHATEYDPEQPQPRLAITGRLGRNPYFRTTPRGTLVASFPVAVAEDDGSTTWHRVVAFGERAERLREALKSGDRVEVIGYLHERQRRQRDGSARTVEELYAAVIKPR